MTNPTPAEGGQLSNRRGRKPTHPWNIWLDGGRHSLAKGRDFHIDAFSLQKQAQNEARRRGLKIRTKRATSDGVEWLLIDGRVLPAPRKRHNWDALFEKAKTVKQVVLTRGEDFEPEAETFRVMVLQAAQRRHLEVATRVIERKHITVSLVPATIASSVTETALGEES